MNGAVTTMAATPPATRDWLTPVELIVLGAIWGGSFLFMRVAAPEFGAVPLVQVRLALGALALLPALWVARHAFAWRQLPLLTAIGIVNSALPFLLFAWAAERAPAGIGAITNSLTVLFTALVAFLVWGEKIGRLRSLAMLAGFVGVVVLAAGRTAGASVMEASIAGTTAALCYGFGANLVRRRLAGLPPVALGAATLGPSALLLIPLSSQAWPSAPISWEAWVSACLLGLVCTGLAYAFYFRLIKRIGAPRAVTVTYLIPLFGVGWSWLLLGETPSVSMFVAGGLILGSVAVSQYAATRR